MVGLIGLGVSAASSMYGMAKAGKERRSYNDWLDRQQREALDWYRKEYNTDYLDTAEGRSQHQMLKTLLKKNYKTIDNSAVKTGATAESNLANKEQSADTLAKATSNLAALGTRRKDSIRREYLSRKSHLDALRGENIQAQSQSWSNFASNAGQLGSSIIEADASGAFKDIFKKKSIQ